MNTKIPTDINGGNVVAPEKPRDTNLNVLYNTVSNNYDLGTPKEFSERMLSRENRKVFYNTVGEKFDLGSVDEFEQRILPDLPLDYLPQPETQEQKIPEETVSPAATEEMLTGYLRDEPKQMPIEQETEIPTTSKDYKTSLPHGMYSVKSSGVGRQYYPAVDENGKSVLKPIIPDEWYKSVDYDVVKLNTDEEVKQLKDSYNKYLADVYQKGEIDNNQYNEAKRYIDKIKPTKSLTTGVPPSYKDQILPTEDQSETISEVPPLTYKDKIREIYDNPTQLLAYVNDADFARQMIGVSKAANKLKEGKELTRDEFLLLDDFQNTNKRDSTFGYKSLDVLAKMLPYMQEFMTTAGIYTAGKKATEKLTKEGLEFLLKDKAKDLLAKKSSQFGLKVAAGIGGATLQHIPVGAARIAGETVGNTVPVFDLKNGKVVKTGDKRINAFLKANATNWVETVSEHSGGLLGGISKVIPETAATSAIVNAIKKANPNKSKSVINKIVKGTAYNGVWGEFFEERMAMLGNWLLGQGDFNLPSGEQIALELTTFSVPGIAFNTASTIGEYKEKRKTQKGMELLDDLDAADNEEERQKVLGELNKYYDKDTVDELDRLSKEEPGIEPSATEKFNQQIKESSKQIQPKPPETPEDFAKQALSGIVDKAYDDYENGKITQKEFDKIYNDNMALYKSGKLSDEQTQKYAEQEINRIIDDAYDDYENNRITEKEFNRIYNRYSNIKKGFKTQTPIEKLKTETDPYKRQEILTEIEDSIKYEGIEQPAEEGTPVGKQPIKETKPVEPTPTTPEEKIVPETEREQAETTQKKPKETETIPTAEINFESKDVEEGVKGSQGRVDIFKEIIQTGKDARQFKAEDVLAPITIERKGDKWVTPDGNHRLMAYKQLGIKQIPVKIKETTKPKKPAPPKVYPEKEPVVSGTQGKARTEAGTEIDYDYAVYDANDVMTSHDIDLKINKEYPTEKQPRDRLRIASETQIDSIQKKLMPERLGENPMASEGAPIVDKSGIVEAGNARIIALKRVYQSNPENAQKYKEWLLNNADKFGLNKEQIQKTDNPILVRRRLSDVNVPKFVQEANVQATAAMSATEQAVSDAKIVSDQTLGMFVPNETGEINTAKNRDFIRTFVNEVIGESEQGRYFTNEGVLSQEGVNRVRNAVFAKAFGDTQAIERLSESTDDNTRNITNALVNVAPKYALLKKEIKQGRYDYDITDDILQATNKLSVLRSQGVPLNEYLAQTNMFGEDISPIAKTILEMFDANKRSARKITNILANYTELVNRIGDPKQTNMFSEIDNPTKDELIAAAIEGGDSLDQTSIFESETAGGEETIGGTERKTREEERSERGSIRIGKENQESFKSTNPDIAERIEASHGIKDETIYNKTVQGIHNFINKATREFEHLPKSGEFAIARFKLLQLSKQFGVATDNANRKINTITEYLSKPEYKTFEYKVLLDDLKELSQKGIDLPFKYTPYIVTKDLAEIEKYMNDNIKDALKKRSQIWKEIRANHISAMESIGEQVGDKFWRKNYYRHQVLDYAKAKSLFGTGKRLKTPTGRSYMKKIKGSLHDINTDYIQAEHEVMAQMLYDTQVALTLKAIEDNYSITDQLKSAAMDNLKQTTDMFKEDDFGDDMSWQALIPEGYTEWQPKQGNLFYHVDTIPAKIAEALTTHQLEMIGISAKDIGSALAMGQKRRSYVIPTELAETLDNITTNPAKFSYHYELLKKWKQWQLISPRRFAKYNIRNLSGDADAAFLGNPTSFKKVPQAITELWNAYYSAKELTGNLKEFFDRGASLATLQAQEMGDLRNLNNFRDLYEPKRTDIPKEMWDKYWQNARISTDFRENILRYANFLSYIEQMKKNEDNKPDNFGASNPEEIMALDNIYDRAYWLSNDLLGAYDRVGVIGQNLRSLWFPFWSWKEVNFRRYVQIFKNAAMDKNIAMTVGRKMVGAGITTPYKLYRIGKTVIHAHAFYTMIALWNKIIKGDDDDDLPEDVRKKPHITLGKDSDGKVMYFTRIGALGDIYEWINLDSLPYLTQEYMSGKIGLRDIAIEMGKAPVNVLAGGGEPFIKLSMELLLRRSLYPDVFEPGTVRSTGLHIARSFGLGDEYIALTGMPSRGYLKTVPELFIYRTDPLEASYWDIQNEKRRFLKSKGETSTGFWITPKGNALYNIKTALRYRDNKAAKKYLKEYIEWVKISLGYKGRTADSLSTAEKNEIKDSIRKGLSRSFASMSPAYGLSEEERKEFLLYLGEDGRERLVKAIKYYNGLMNAGEEPTNTVNIR